ncbi:Uncharacterised protein [BD1-7 clade bacterium]|uniref:UPF0178 protein OPDIPICF_03285 n=1 Tax=BD1-7 clade bacterium TaxID=2029982 RepID=A0A5S9R097_9GAMM|nr:Uncharacterised protein [BD1-7 clade bacterium]
MKIWVDADACPVAVREIICRAANRTETPATFVANHFIRIPPSKFLSMRQVSSGFDVADDEIVQSVEAGDIVISSDIPLAAEALEKGAIVITSRGERYTLDNIKPRLNMRDFMETMRSSGVQTGGPPALSQADRQAFANQLDRLLAQKS